MFCFLFLAPYARTTRYEEAMKRLFCLKAKNGLGRFALSALPHYKWNDNRQRVPEVPR